MQMPFLMGVTGTSRSAGFSVLIIGVSNTEPGFISLVFADTLRNYYPGGSSGTGYIPHRHAGFISGGFRCPENHMCIFSV